MFLKNSHISSNKKILSFFILFVFLLNIFPSNEQNFTWKNYSNEKFITESFIDLQSTSINLNTYKYKSQSKFENRISVSEDSKKFSNLKLKETASSLNKEAGFLVKFNFFITSHFSTDT